jgi:hypothetical protein
MSKFFITVINCLKLKSFSLFTVLLNEVPFIIKRSNKKNKASFHYTSTGLYGITVGKFISRKELNTALLHEIGHFIDFKKIKNRKGIIFAFKKFNSSNYLKQGEKNAWKYALYLEKKYNKKICYNVARLWLKSYNTSYARLDNKV